MAWRAYEVLRVALSYAPRRGPGDAHWFYYASRSEVGSRMLDELRREVRP